MSNILLTGGAGYIGSHVAKLLSQETPHKLFIFDNLTTGHALNVRHFPLIRGDIRDYALLSEVLKTNKIEVVMHFAALTDIPQSLASPFTFYENNVFGTLQLLKACAQHQIRHFIFSSTAAVYGAITSENIPETHPLAASNPYGQSKIMCERMIEDAAKAYDLRYVNLRYFNVAGAAPCATIGQRADDAQHLIKIVAKTALGKLPAIPIFGGDYNTQDGTCIRDFIHVLDLSTAHLKAMEHLLNNGSSLTLNCGYGVGYSIKEIIQAAQTVTRKNLPHYLAPKRQGDLPRVVADNQQIQKQLHWQPRYNDIQFIVKTALAFEAQLS